jgi:tRNA (guanine-N7-)-methyltransferase
VRIVDVGCGFGGLTVALAGLFPDKLVVGMEIRAKVCEYVRLRIQALRDELPGSYQNAACLR